MTRSYLTVDKICLRLHPNKSEILSCKHIGKIFCDDLGVKIAMSLMSSESFPANAGEDSYQWSSKIHSKTPKKLHPEQ